ncbi:unnamed protein product [Periconia digitata]|uniref:Uncharacterized protein n=1 Tax=Periconia digitata TaxID=1303443 RepID=A0A9W4ULZ8_9PLEO|nr:unnamed protein product [Periconia digitata]
MTSPPSLTPPFTERHIPPVKSRHSGNAPTGDANQDQNTTQQPVLESVTNIPLTALESLPTIAGRNGEVYLTKNKIGEFLQWDLDLKRLNLVHGHLWMAGRPMRGRPLHRYKMLGLEILPTQQMDLHFLRYSDRLMIKPLAEYMLDHAFWVEHICPHKTLHENACGLLLSYVWLLTSPIDLKLAHEIYLLPSFVTWAWWKTFVTDFESHIDLNALDKVNKRFHFGELRLSRINSIFRIRYAPTHFVRGYLYGYNRYVVYFQRRFGWILIVFVFFSLVLAAMQVGASVEPLQSNQDFIRSCYVFVVFSMLAVAAILGAVGLMFMCIYIYNMGKAIAHVFKAARERKRVVHESKKP